MNFDTVERGGLAGMWQDKHKPDWLILVTSQLQVFLQVNSNYWNTGKPVENNLLQVRSNPHDILKDSFGHRK